MSPREGMYSHHGRLIAFLKRIALRLQVLTALEFLLLLASTVILMLIGNFFAQELREAIPYLPFIFIIVALSLFFLLMSLGFYRILIRPSMGKLAREVEQKFPELKDDVTNALLLCEEMENPLYPGEISQELVAAHLGKTAEEVSAIPPNRVVNFRQASRHLRLFTPLLIVFFILLAVDPQWLNRSLATLLHPLSSLPMRETSLSVEPQNITVLRGTPLLIKAKAAGYIPDRLTLLVWPEAGETIRIDLESQGDGTFLHRIASVQNSFRFQVTSGRSSSSVSTIRVVEAPEILGIRLTLVPPEYTRLPKEVTHEGHIEALKGTVVTLEAQVNKAVKEAKLILHQGNELRLNVEADRLTGNLPILHPGAYSIHVKDDLGFENIDPVSYRIHLIPDKYPEGDILSPAEDLEVSGTEIAPIVYGAKDDFGITAVRLSYQTGGSERFIALKGPGATRSVGPEVFRWDLTGLALAPGDRVVYRLEVWDNDSVSGPKVGYSRTFSLTVREEKDRASKEAEEAQQLSDALLDLLADQLEEKKDREALSRQMTRILDQVDKNLESVGPEKIQHFDLEALRRNLASLQQRIHQETNETITRELERLSLLSEELTKKARMNEVEALAREIRNRQRRLMDALRDHKGPLSPELLETMLKELDKLRQLLHTVMETLSKMATQLPDEFINSPELSDLEFQDLFSDLDEIQKKLMSGDLAGAMEAAQRLLQALSEMMAAMARAGAQANQGSFDRLQSEMSRQASELDHILDEQKKILSGTEGIDRDLKRKMEEEIEKRLSQSLGAFQEILEGLRHSLPSEQRDSITELEKFLKEGRIEKFSRLGESLRKELSASPGAQKRIDQLLEMADTLIPDPEDVLTPEERQQFPGLSSRQDKLEKRTRTLTEKLEMLAQLFPGMDSDILNDLKGAAESMHNAMRRLREEDAPAAIPPEQDAIRSLSKSQQSMQQMAQQMAMQMQANRWGYPLAYDPRPGWYYGPWVPMPTLPQPESKRPREKGYTGIDREEFEPPSKDAYKAPQILREKVMEALKEDIPSQYKKEVERYFKGLTE